MNWGVGKIIARGPVRSGREAKFDRVKLIAIEQNSIVVDKRPRRVPDYDGPIRPGFPARGHQSGRKAGKIISNESTRVIKVRRGIIEPISDSAIHIQEDILLSNGIDGMSPEEDSGIPQISSRVRVVEILEKVGANDPIMGRVSADAVEVANSGPVVARRASRVFKPAVFDNPVVYSQSGVDIGGVGFNELRSRIQEAHAINVRRLSSRVENYLVIISVPDGEVRNS